MFRFDCLACGTTLSFGPGQFEAWCNICEAGRPLPAKFPAEFDFEAVPPSGLLTLGAARDAHAQCGACRAVLSAAERLERCTFCASGTIPFSTSGTVLSAKSWLPSLLDESAARVALRATCEKLGVPPETTSLTLVQLLLG